MELGLVGALESLLAVSVADDSPFQEHWRLRTPGVLAGILTTFSRMPLDVFFFFRCFMHLCN